MIRQRTVKNLMKLKEKTNAKSGNWEGSTPCNKQHRLGAAWLGSSSAEKNLGVLADWKLGMSLQCALAAKVAKSILGHMNHGRASRLMEAIIPLGLAHIRPHLDNVSSFVHPNTGKALIN